MKVAVKTVKKVVKKKAVKETDYQKNVINVNRALKNERKSLGGCIKTLLMFNKEINMNPTQVKVLRFIQKDQEAYKGFKKIVRTSHYKGKDLGTYSPFYILQSLNKNIAEMTKPSTKA